MPTRRSFLGQLGLGSVALAWSGPVRANTSSALPITGRLQERLTEAIYGFVVADAMGGTIENDLPTDILTQWGDWDFTQFIPNQNPKEIEKGTGKGNGRTTDDTLNFENLISCYIQQADHLDAYSYAAHVTARHWGKVERTHRSEESKPRAAQRAWRRRRVRSARTP